jgi:ubiquitin-protein ligase
MIELDDARYRRLLAEQNELIGLAMNSPFIELEPVESQPGWPPDEYIITYTCKGIAAIDEDRNPVYSERHRVRVKFSEHYPMQEPYLKWLTPIWHPNILHKPPGHVCTDNPKTWWAGKRMVEIVKFMGELVQYKRYHAERIPPFPVDVEAAEWVLKYAEPNRIVGPNNPIDPRALENPPLYQGQPAMPEASLPANKEVEREVMTFGILVQTSDTPVRVMPGPALGAE